MAGFDPLINHYLMYICPYNSFSLWFNIELYCVFVINWRNYCSAVPTVLLSLFLFSRWWMQLLIPCDFFRCHVLRRVLCNNIGLLFIDPKCSFVVFFVVLFVFPQLTIQITNLFQALGLDFLELCSKWHWYKFRS